MAQPMIDHEEHKQAFERDEVIKIINSVISKVEHAGDVSRDMIFGELKELRKVIEDTRKEVGATGAGDIKHKHIPTATDELGAVVEATEEASGAIMDACDVIQEKASQMGGDAGDAIAAEVVKIFEACSFQDITGQRITKVITTLCTIEEKVNRLLAAAGGHAGVVADDSEDEGKESAGGGDDGLLNGPQLPGHAVTQDDIDKLLAEFD